MGRCFDRGWELIAVPDGRRGLWMRRSSSGFILELCAGREGDDAYVKLDIGEPITIEVVHGIVDVLRYLEWSESVRKERE